MCSVAKQRQGRSRILDNNIKDKKEGGRVIVTAKIFLGISKCGWNVQSHRDEFTDRKRS